MEIEFPVALSFSTGESLGFCCSRIKGSSPRMTAKKRECLHFLPRFDILLQISFFSLCLLVFSLSSFPYCSHQGSYQPPTMSISMSGKWTSVIRATPILSWSHLPLLSGHFSSHQEPMDRMVFSVRSRRLPFRSRIFSSLLLSYSSSSGWSDSSSQQVMRRVSKSGNPILSGHRSGFLWCR